MLGKKTLIAASLFIALSFSEASWAQNRYITIGTGGLTGVYYPTGGAICRFLNRGRSEHHIRCSVESTGGSIYNLNTIRTGELDMGVAQSDWQYHAYHGTDVFEDSGPNENLRAVFSIHAEPVTIVARKDASITSLRDLKGKIVNIGNPGSGTRATAERLVEALGWTMDDFLLASELKSSEQSQALCDNKIHAFIVAVGHPSGTIQEATTTCETVIVPVTGPEVDELVEANDYYRHAFIPGGMYEGTPNDVATFGVAATFVTSSETEADIIYEVVKAVFSNFEMFKRGHSAFSTLKKEEMVKDGLSAPLHEGARQYYEEAGLL